MFNSDTLAFINTRMRYFLPIWYLAERVCSYNLEKKNFACWQICAEIRLCSSFITAHVNRFGKRFTASLSSWNYFREEMFDISFFFFLRIFCRGLIKLDLLAPKQICPQQGSQCNSRTLADTANWVHCWKSSNRQEGCCFMGNNQGHYIPLICLCLFWNMAALWQWGEWEQRVKEVPVNKTEMSHKFDEGTGVFPIFTTTFIKFSHRNQWVGQHVNGFFSRNIGQVPTRMVDAGINHKKTMQ